MLMAFYHLLRDKNGSQNCWALMGLASHMAQNVRRQHPPLISTDIVFKIGLRMFFVQQTRYVA